MTVLDFDLGNTRLKWRLVNDVGAILGGDLNYDALPNCYLDSFSDVDRVRVSSVVAEALELQLRDWCRQVLSVEAEFVRVTAHCSGVVCGYKEPALLGVDRWMAVLAAFNHCADACLVLDCGTAITLDVVDNHGLHLGGYILPGFSTMAKSLSSNTALLPNFLPTESLQRLDLGGNTSECVSHGLVSMVVSLVEKIQAEKNIADNNVIITGGGAKVLQKFLPSANIVNDLIFEGIALALP